MISDAVVDTNVLMHAQDSTSDRFENAIEFLTAFMESAAVLRVDPGFTWNESTNRSLIGQEYLTHLQHGSVGFSFVEVLARSERVVEAEKVVSNKLRRKSNQMIRKPRDRTFLRVAVNTAERILVSHDYEDFQIVKRGDIRRIFDVNVIEASEAATLIND